MITIFKTKRLLYSHQFVINPLTLYSAGNIATNCNLFSSDAGMREMSDEMILTWGQFVRGKNEKKTKYMLCRRHVIRDFCENVYLIIWRHSYLVFWILNILELQKLVFEDNGFRRQWVFGWAVFTIQYITRRALMEKVRINVYYEFKTKVYFVFVRRLIVSGQLLNNTRFIVYT